MRKTTRNKAVLFSVLTTTLLLSVATRSFGANETTNGGWSWVSGASGTTGVIDGTTWNFSSQRKTTLTSGTVITIKAIGTGVGINATDQLMSARGGANGMYMDNSIVSVTGAQLVTTDDGCTYGVMCSNRGQFEISFSPAATDPIIHFSGLGGGGVDSGTNGKTTAWTEFQLVNSGVTMTVLGQQNLGLVGSNRIELTTKNPTTSCSSTTNSYGATASAGCGSIKLSGTFTSITLQADLNSVNNAANPYIGGQLEDAFIMAVTVDPALATTTVAPATTTVAPASTTVAPVTTAVASVPTTVAPNLPSTGGSESGVTLALLAVGLGSVMIVVRRRMA